MVDGLRGKAIYRLMATCSTANLQVNGNKTALPIYRLTNTRQHCQYTALYIYSLMVTRQFDGDVVALSIYTQFDGHKPALPIYKMQQCQNRVQQSPGSFAHI